MGLDTVEFLFAVEDAFGVSIPNEAAERMATPGNVVDYLESHLPASAGRAACHSQRAFYRLRSAVMTTHGVPRRQVRRDTAWAEILPQQTFGSAWRDLHAAVGARYWPRRHVFGFRVAAAQTVGATATYLAQRTPHSLKAPSQGWTRSEIERVVRQLMWEELGIGSFFWNDRFAQELRVD